MENPGRKTAPTPPRGNKKKTIRPKYLAGKRLKGAPTVTTGGLWGPPPLLAQQPADTTKPARPPPAASVSIPVDFSGVLYANFQYRGDAGPNKSTNKFDVERAYLTFRMPAGDRASIRITADVFQQT